MLQTKHDRRARVSDQADSPNRGHGDEADTEQREFDTAPESTAGDGDPAASGEEPSPDSTDDDAEPDGQPVAADGGDVKTRLREVIHALEALDAEV